MELLLPSMLLVIYLCAGQITAVAAFAAVEADIRQTDDQVCGKDRLNRVSEASLHVRANVLYGDRDEEVVPVADAKFHLLSRSLIETLKSEKFELPPVDNPDNLSLDELYLQGAALALLASEEKNARRITALVAKAIAKHQIAVLKTTARGEADLARIAPGDYFLFGLERSGHEILVWHTDVKIKPGKNHTEIDQHNAAVVFSTKTRFDPNLAVKKPALLLRGAWYSAD